MPNPWLFSSTRENLSCYERNGILFNAGDRTFRDLSFASGADSDGDGRTVASWDVTGDGRPELFVRQAGGGTLVVYENGLPPANTLRLHLRGVRSNRFGVGAKITAEVGRQTIRRELYPIVNFLSQVPAAVHLGLGGAARVDRLTVHWPSGEAQHFTAIAANQDVLIIEGVESAEPLAPGESIAQRTAAVLAE